MNNLSFYWLHNKLEELERSSIKLVIDGVTVYIMDMQYINGKELSVQYICFDKKSEDFEFNKKLNNAVQQLITKELQQGKKWYKILFSKIYALIKNIRKRFGRS